MAARRRPKDRLPSPQTPMAGRAARRPVAAPPAPAPEPLGPAVGRAGRRAALVMMATGVLWVLATWAGGALGLPQRVRALFDLFALFGFGLGLWMTFHLWRARRGDAE